MDFNSNNNVRAQIEGKRVVSRKIVDHDLTIGTTKLCIRPRNEKGHRVRKYLSQMEERCNDPDAVIARVMVENRAMEPKAAYFDDLVDRHVKLSGRETAKALRKESEYDKPWRPNAAP